MGTRTGDLSPGKMLSRKGGMLQHTANPLAESPTSRNRAVQAVSQVRRHSINSISYSDIATAAIPSPQKKAGGNQKVAPDLWKVARGSAMNYIKERTAPPQPGMARRNSFGSATDLSKPALFPETPKGLSKSMVRLPPMPQSTVVQAAAQLEKEKEELIKDREEEHAKFEADKVDDEKAVQLLNMVKDVMGNWKEGGGDPLTLPSVLVPTAETAECIASQVLW